MANELADALRDLARAQTESLVKIVEEMREDRRRLFARVDQLNEARAEHAIRIEQAEAIAAAAVPQALCAKTHEDHQRWIDKLVRNGTARPGGDETSFRVKVLWGALAALMVIAITALANGAVARFLAPRPVIQVVQPQPQKPGRAP